MSKITGSDAVWYQRLYIFYVPVLICSSTWFEYLDLSIASVELLSFWCFPYIYCRERWLGPLCAKLCCKLLQPVTGMLQPVTEMYIVRIGSSGKIMEEVKFNYAQLRMTVDWFVLFLLVCVNLEKLILWNKVTNL